MIGLLIHGSVSNMFEPHRFMVSVKTKISSRWNPMLSHIFTVLIMKLVINNSVNLFLFYLRVTECWVAPSHYMTTWHARVLPVICFYFTFLKKYCNCFVSQPLLEQLLYLFFLSHVCCMWLSGCSEL